MKKAPAAGLDGRGQLLTSASRELELRRSHNHRERSWKAQAARAGHAVPRKVIFQGPPLTKLGAANGSLSIDTTAKFG